MEDRQFSALTRFSKTIQWSAILSFELIILGSLVRATDSGLACPDWPLCFARFLPTFDYKIFLEWFHRFSALCLGGVLLYAVYQLIRQKFLRNFFSLQLYGVLLLFFSQCILGGLTVLKLLEPKIVSLHLMNALLFFSTLMWLFMRSLQILQFEKRVYALKRSFGFKVSLSLATVGVFVQLMLGGMVSSNHAGLVCSSFPDCYGGYFFPPVSSWLIALQIWHRIVAYALFILSIAQWWVFRNEKTPPIAKFTLWLFPLLLCVQILLGVVNIFYYLPVWASVAHLTNGLSIFSLLLMSTIESLMTISPPLSLKPLNAVKQHADVGYTKEITHES